jgi:hypothetical protein
MKRILQTVRFEKNCVSWRINDNHKGAIALGPVLFKKSHVFPLVCVGCNR